MNSTPSANATTLLDNQTLKKLLNEKDEFIDRLCSEYDEESKRAEERHERIVREFENKIKDLTIKYGQLNEQLNSEVAKNNALLNNQQKLEEELKKADKCPTYSSGVHDENYDNLLMENASLKEKLETLELNSKLFIKEFEHVYAMNEELNESLVKLKKELADQVEFNSELQRDLSIEKKNSSAKILELETELHTYKCEPENARGNNLFAEAIQGKEKQEQEMLDLFNRYEHLCVENVKLKKFLQERSANEDNSRRRDLLTGPTLNAFKKMKDELVKCQFEKDRISVQLKTIQEQTKQADQGPLLGKRKYGGIILDDEFSKERSEQRIRELELQNRDLMESVCYERKRADGVPTLEAKIETLNKLIAQHEKKLKI